MLKKDFFLSKIIASYVTAAGFTLLMALTLWLLISGSSKYPWFWPNDFLHNVNTEYLDYVKEFDFAIAYNIRSSEHHDPYKILACKDEYTWVMITKKYDGPFNVGYSTITLDTIFVMDANIFMDSLIQYKLFSMPSDEVLIEKCDGSVWDLPHGEIMEIEIIQGLKVRRMSYISPEYRHAQCPAIEEWRNLYHIKKLFDEKWRENNDKEL
jgi:hypothetical protein